MLPGVVLPKVDGIEESGLKRVEKGNMCSVNVVGNRYASYRPVYIYDIVCTV